MQIGEPTNRLFHTLNKIKINALTSANYIIKYIYDRNISGNIREIPFIYIIDELIQISYTSLKWLTVT